jgi:hypothetical protein
MSESRSSISNASSYAEIGEFWDRHDLGAFEEQTSPVDFDVRLGSPSRVYVPVERELAESLRNAAVSQGLSTETLLNGWLKEKLEEQSLRR